MQLPHYLGLLHRAEQAFAEALREVAAAHGEEPDIARACERMARQSLSHAAQLGPFVERYGEAAEAEPERLHSALFAGARSGPLALLRDLQDLYLMACECDIVWTLVGQASRGARDEQLQAVVTSCAPETALAQAWLRTRMMAAAPQSLVVA